MDIPVISISGYKYYLLVLDDFSHYLWTFPLRQKSNTFPTLSHFFAWVSTQFGHTIRSIQCDNGREFYNNASRDFSLSRGVHLRMSCPYTSPQNGRAERMIRTTNDVMRSLLFQASLPAHYWAEALTAATYLNRLPTKAVAHPTPYFALFGIHPSYDHLRVFGCACYPNLASTTPHKLAPRSTRCVFLGYSPDHKGYQCLDLTSHRVLISRHIVFDELDFSFSSSSSTASLTELDVFLDPAPVSPTIAPLSCRFIHRASSRGPACDALPRIATCGLGVPCVASRDPTDATLPRTATCGLSVSSVAACGLGVPCVASRDPPVPLSPAQPRAASTSPASSRPALSSRYTNPIQTYQRRGCRGALAHPRADPRPITPSSSTGILATSTRWSPGTRQVSSGPLIA
jgi:hypothetical protein